MTQTKNRNLTEVYITIAHEMVHVKQFIKQNLSDKYSNKRPHHDRWWEREANAKSKELVKKYVDILYNMV
jgi:vacuolar-type H+-ATPase catalytic subunit A/Vma1